MSNRIGRYTSRGSNLNAIMDNTEFGPVVMKYYGLYVQIPQDCLNKDGMPRKNIRRRLKEGFTVQNVKYLQDKGIKIMID